MPFSEITTIIELTLTAIGLILIVFGWLIPYYQHKKLDQNRKEEELKLQKLMWEKETVDQQISKFYGPIHILLQEQNVLFDNITFMFGRKYIFKAGQELNHLTEDEKKIWIHFVDTYLLPHNNKIMEIIRQNYHLMYKFDIPNSFYRYFNYAVGWEQLDSQSKNGVPNYYQYYFQYNFPQDFTQYINETLKLLEERKEELIKQTQI